MAIKFENALDVQPQDNGRDWLVLEDFYYDTDIELSGIAPIRFEDRHPDGSFNVVAVTRVRVEKGFITDFGSIPRIAWPLVGGPADSKARKAFAIHDKLYRTKGLCTRKQADDVLLECMKFSGCSWWQRTVIYSAVRIGGMSSYKGGL